MLTSDLEDNERDKVALNKVLSHIHQEDLTFGTRTGTRKGVEAHMFRVETPRELANWSRSLVQGAHDAATLIKEINCGKSFTTNNWCYRL